MKDFNLFKVIKLIICSKLINGSTQFSKILGVWSITSALYSGLVQYSIDNTFIYHFASQLIMKPVSRIFRLPLQKESEAIESFKHFSVVLNELDIPILYSTNILQLIVNSAKKEPTWSSAHGQFSDF